MIQVATFAAMEEERFIMQPKYPKFLMVFIAIINLFYSIPAISDVFFTDGFETNNLSHSENGFRWTDSVSGQVNSVNPKSGSSSYEFLYTGGPDGEDSWSELRFSLGGYYPDLWVSYDLYIPDNYYHRSQSSSANNKGHLYLWTGSYGNPDGIGLGPNLWPNGSGGSNASMYVWGSGHDEHYWGACSNIIEASDQGKWLHIVIHYKYATASNNDGVARIWKIYEDGSGKIPCNITDGRWYAAGASGFDTGYILGWANSGFDTDTRFYLDNVVFSTTHLLTGISTVPKPPVPNSIVE